jgi:hypothetical protein
VMTLLVLVFVASATARTLRATGADNVTVWRTRFGLRACLIIHRFAPHFTVLETARVFPTAHLSRPRPAAMMHARADVISNEWSRHECGGEGACARSASNPRMQSRGSHDI